MAVNSSNATISPAHLHLEDNVAFLMASVTFRMEQDLRNYTLRKLDITYVQFRVLQFLHEANGKSISEIARALAVRPAVLSRIVSQMEERALVARKSDPDDSRSTQVHLTDEGRARYAQAWPSAYKIIQYALGVLDEDERENLTRSMRKLSAHLCL